MILRPNCSRKHKDPFSAVPDQDKNPSAIIIPQQNKVTSNIYLFNLKLSADKYSQKTAGKKNPYQVILSLKSDEYCSCKSNPAVNKPLTDMYQQEIQVCEGSILNRPGVAGAVLQTPPYLIHSLSN